LDHDSPILIFSLSWGWWMCATMPRFCFFHWDGNLASFFAYRGLEPWSSRSQPLK
jgi:hypothetical protein